MAFAIKVEAAFGANPAASPGTWTWTDISTYVLGRNGNKVSITRGRQDEASQAQPSVLTLELNNSDGRFTPDNPASPYYPNVTLNLPLRVSVNPGTGFASRGVFFANIYAPSWGQSTSFTTVIVTANGTLRRLGQGGKPLRSPMYRAAQAAGAVAQWAFEDQAGASRTSSGVLGQPDGLIYGGILPVFGAQGPAGAVSAMDLRTGGALVMSPINGVSATGWTLEFSFMSSETPAQSHKLWIGTNTTGTSDVGGILFEPVSASPFYMGCFVIGNDSSTLASLSPTTHNVFDGQWHTYRLQMADSGANVVAQLSIDGVPTNNATFAAPNLGAINAIWVNDGNELLGQGFMSGLNIYNTPYSGSLVWNPTVDTSPAVHAYTGESASDRLTRICAQQGVTLTLAGTSRKAMGPQPIATFMDVIRECEAADGGMLYDAFDGSLGYLSQLSRYNLGPSMVIDNNAGQLPPGFAPIKDDLLIRNDWTVSRSQGSSAEYMDQASIGTAGLYDDSATLNVADDGSLLDQAAWRVHLGLAAGLRYPQILVDLVVAPELIPSWLGCDVGERITLRNLPSQHPTGDVDLILQGYSESFDAVSWQAIANCSPFAPWQVGVADSYTGKADSSSSTLASSVSAGSVGASITLSVGTANSGDLWTLDSTQWTAGQNGPLYVIYGGEIAQVTNITGASSPQSITVTRGTNGVAIAHASGTPVHVYQPALAAL